MHKWKLHGDLQILSLDNGFFLFKFSDPEDCLRVLEGDSHSVGGRPLILHRWDPDSPLEKKLTDVPVWIRLLGLHLKLWSHHCLSRIASMLGKPLYKDSHTADATRLKYACFCVQVNVDQSLPNSIKLKTSKGEINQPITYEWKPRACTNCRDFSHISENCDLNTRQPQAPIRKEWREIQKHSDATLPHPHPSVSSLIKNIPKGQEDLHQIAINNPNRYAALAAKEPDPSIDAPPGVVQFKWRN
ncbi:uncharacterized protein LOC143891663 [Tasmannia lanceolata]|uniref:uncharacterized protein LOC143891663 n=1 Tax=Tasmannia lanceolata TaxID=3420 RepID=UPI0040636338